MSEKKTEAVSDEEYTYGTSEYTYESDDSDRDDTDGKPRFIESYELTYSTINGRSTAFFVLGWR